MKSEFLIQRLWTMICLTFPLVVLGQSESGKSGGEILREIDFATLSGAWLFHDDKVKTHVQENGWNGKSVLEIEVFHVPDQVVLPLLFQSRVHLDEGVEYMVSVWGRSDKERMIQLGCNLGEKPWPSLGLKEKVQMGPKWVKYEFKFKANKTTDNANFYVNQPPDKAHPTETGKVLFSQPSLKVSDGASISRLELKDEGKIEYEKKDPFNSEFVAGSILNLDSQASTLSVSIQGKVEPEVYHINQETKILRSGEMIGVGELHKGMKVEVFPAADPLNAGSIVVR